MSLKKSKNLSLQKLMVNNVKHVGKPLISKKTIDLLQYRIQEEENSSRVYLSMSMWL